MKPFSSLWQLCTELFCGLLHKYLLVRKLNNAHIIRWVFFEFSVDESCMAVWVLYGSLLVQFLSMAISWMHISQGRMATRLRCGGIFNNCSLQIYCWISQWENFENWLTFNGVTDTSLVVCFFRTQCIIQFWYSELCPAAECIHTPIFGSRPSDHYFRSVCLFVCLFVQSFSQPSLIRFRSNLDICYISGSSCVP